MQVTTACLAKETSTFILKGKVKNFKKSYFEFGTTNYFRNTLSSIMVDNDGNFSKDIYISGIQDVVVILNNQLVKFFASPGDVIIMNWDESNFNNSFELTSPSNNRSQELNISIAIHNKRYTPFLELQEILTESLLIPDSTKYRLINESYNAELTIIKAFGPPKFTNRKFLYDTYFKHASLLNDSLRHKYQLKTDHENSNLELDGFGKLYLSEECFKLSSIYRDFLFNNVRDVTNSTNNFSINSAGIFVFNPAKEEYNRGGILSSSSLIKDWYSAKSLIFSFEHYKYEYVQELYDRFLSSNAHQKYVDTIKTFYGNFSRLKPGLLAPKFSLKDVNGKTVSLDDFKGKVVYIDFWGVYCGPCLGEIGENAEKVHQKYKGKNIVFVNICVDETGKAWQDKIAALKLSGINLVAEGRMKNSVSIDYHINGIPHYVLIDKHGILIDNNAPWLFQLIGDSRNIIDETLDR